ncbi:lectin c-type domain protein [Plakobranchus ocellatus]|uniref:Lectin c-type domain protein n=1 Tax=Plakobranchus ocellatus TaxID=259542 RepID=A0AAV3XW34_9GAST|nr:lectin c-type domain protein [Plakobranchus ocellatus]
MDLRHHDFVGSVEVKLEELLDESRSLLTTTKTLRVPGDPRSRGLIHLTTETVEATKSKIQVHIAANRLGKVGIIKRKPDCFLEIGRQIDSITFHPVFRTEVAPKTRHPWWRPLEVSVQRLCNDDWDRPIQFSCWHTSYGSGSNTYENIGQCSTTLRELSAMPLEGHYRSLSLSCPKKDRTSDRKRTHFGLLRLHQFRVDMQYSLLDYIQGGCLLRLIIAFDFTASNGVLSDPLSLHSLEKNRNNQYLNALEALGSVIARYDPEQKVAVFGFGAKPSLSAPTDFCLQLTQSGWVRGIKGVSEAYLNILPSLTFAGPTYLAPVLDKAMEMADVKVTQEEQGYYVLLVITDGIINDVETVVKKLVIASSLPLSVIIVGVGPSDFTLMVQETLAALSFQVLQYMKLRNISPQPACAVRIDPSASWVTPRNHPQISQDGDPLSYLTQLDAESVSSPLEKLTGNIDPTTEADIVHEQGSRPLKSRREMGGGSFRLKSRQSSRQSLVQRDITGLYCPTCGSCIDPGNATFNDNATTWKV